MGYLNLVIDSISVNNKVVVIFNERQDMSEDLKKVFGPLCRYPNMIFQFHNFLIPLTDYHNFIVVLIPLTLNRKKIQSFNIFKAMFRYNIQQ